MKRNSHAICDDHSAATIAAKFPRYTLSYKGDKLTVPVTFVDEDVVEVRLSDLPPETPNTVIQDTLAQYGEVKSVTSEVWQDFFPGVLTGVRIARMKLTSSISSYVKIGDHIALVHYAGMKHTCKRCGSESHLAKKCPEKRAGQSLAAQQQTPGNTNNNSNKQNHEHRDDQVKDHRSLAQQKSPTAAEKQQQQQKTSAEGDEQNYCPMEQGEVGPSSGYTVVSRRKGKVPRLQQPEPKKKTASSDCVVTQLNEGEQKTADMIAEAIVRLGKYAGADIPMEELKKVSKKTYDKLQQNKL